MKCKRGLTKRIIFKVFIDIDNCSVKFGQNPTIEKILLSRVNKNIFLN